VKSRKNLRRHQKQKNRNFSNQLPEQTNLFILKLTTKDYIIILFAIALTITIIILLTRKDPDSALLHEHIQRQKNEITLLEAENDSLQYLKEKYIQIDLELEKTVNRLKDSLSNQQPKIIYIIKKIKQYENDSIILPNDSGIDSLFNSKLQNR